MCASLRCPEHHSHRWAGCETVLRANGSQLGTVGSFEAPQRSYGQIWPLVWSGTNAQRSQELTPFMQLIIAGPWWTWENSVEAIDT